ncbi:MAG TPA: ribulose-bisphosphate carboxylase large subunit family protein [Terriglobia bacterium]|nr:ribulose-bisphosphate carboxylase large subunit family protein [Terriglobia bacterium]
MKDHVAATYLIETPLAVEHAAEVIAGEQSCGTFARVAGETGELRARHRAQVESIKVLETRDAPSLPGSRVPPGAGHLEYTRAKVVVSFPLDNMGTNLSTLVSTVAGNLYELSEVSGLKLMDIEIPQAFRERYSGPQFGVEGTRRLASVWGRPLIGTIIKPSVGLAPEQTAQLVREFAQAGIDFIKDDELMANPPHSPLEKRVEAVMREINSAAERTGKKVMYAFNITDDLDAMLRHHDAVVRAGGTCVMASLNSVGLGGVSHLRRRCQLPIHGHRNGWGMLNRCPSLGMDFAPYQKLWRLAGVDHLHVNGLKNKFWEPDESVIRSVKACLQPLLGGCPIMPVISSGQWGGQAPETYRLAGTVDLMYLAGGGIMAHPGGPADGLRAIRQAWDAALQGVPLEIYADGRPELQRAIRKFGSPSLREAVVKDHKSS